MLNKSQFIKRFICSSPFQTILFPAPLYQNTLQNFNSVNNIFQYSFSTFYKSPQNIKEELSLLSHLPEDNVTYANEIIGNYISCKDPTTLDSNDIEWISEIFAQLAFVHRAQGNPDKAFTYHIELKDLYRQRAMGETYLNAENCFALAHLHLDKSKPYEAENYFKQVDKICKALGNEKETKSLLVESWGLLASIYLQRDEQDLALKLLDSALKKRRDIKEPLQATLLALAYQDLGAIYSLRNDIDKAIDSWEKGLEIAKQDLPEDSGNAVVFHNSLAQVLHKNGRISEAVIHTKNALSAHLDKILSKKHEGLSWSHTLFYQASRLNQDLSKALEFYSHAIKIYEKSPQTSQNELNNIYFGVAFLHQKLGNIHEACHYFDKFIEALIRRLDGNNLKIATHYFNWATGLEERGEKAKFKGYFIKALALYKKQGSPDHQTIAEAYKYLGDITFEEKDWSSALEYLKECEKYLEKVSEDDSWIHIVQIEIGKTLFELKNYDESMKYFYKSVEIGEKKGDKDAVLFAALMVQENYEAKGMLKEGEEAYAKITDKYLEDEETDDDEK